jgi:hypothetical protein
MSKLKKHKKLQQNNREARASQKNHLENVQGRVDLQGMSRFLLGMCLQAHPKDYHGSLSRRKAV